MGECGLGTERDCCTCNTLFCRLGILSDDRVDLQGTPINAFCGHLLQQLVYGECENCLTVHCVLVHVFLYCCNDIYFVHVCAKQNGISH